MNDRSAAELRAKQKRIAIGMSFAVVYLALVFWAGGWLVRVQPVPPAGRLAFALPWLMGPGLTVFLGVAAIGLARFTSPAMIEGGQLPATSPTEIDRRYLQNTLEQFAVFLPGWLALAQLLPDARLGLVPALALSFVFARLAFWWGYRRASTGRAFGFAATMMANVAIYGWALTLWISG